MTTSWLFRFSIFFDDVDHIRDFDSFCHFCITFALPIRSIFHELFHHTFNLVQSLEVYDVGNTLNSGLFWKRWFEPLQIRAMKVHLGSHGAKYEWARENFSQWLRIQFADCIRIFKNWVITVESGEASTILADLNISNNLVISLPKIQSQWEWILQETKSTSICQWRMPSLSSCKPNLLFLSHFDDHAEIHFWQYARFQGLRRTQRWQPERREV